MSYEQGTSTACQPSVVFCFDSSAAPLSPLPAAEGKRASLRVQDGGVAEWRCTWRKELRAYHVKTGHANGLSTLRYRTVGHRLMGDRVTVVTVDLLGDWDAAAKFDEDNFGQQVTAATTSKFIDQMLGSETERGSGLLPGAPEGDRL